ncbi:Xylulose kinase [Nakaseomyces glabratus]|nr:Xylulose kinase [Nakaseomyces glabratus]KTB24457.1 Xylulose kinase [Nakaseomyces glabratus]
MQGEGYYLGLDLSTQQLKCLAIDGDMQIKHTEVVDFDRDLPHYNTHKGVYSHGDVVECPVGMWLEAIDLVFEKYKGAGFDLSQVKAISGSCQQHGSVYWKTGAGDLLQHLNDANGNLVDQLYPDGFSRKTAPNWQDHSTGKQCTQIEKKAGGPEKLAEITGSRAHFRFTGPQIMKIAENEEDNYKNTETISLVSSFLTSILCAKLVPIEEADACGMNIYDIKAKRYDDSLLDVISGKFGKEDLLKKLSGSVTKCNSPQLMGNIANYFVSKYGFDSECAIYPFTGDNLATICSLPLEKNDILVSLGTSTTILMVTDQYHPSPNYHLFTHPAIANCYMAMICYCNGSLAREKVRDSLNENQSTSWTNFDEAVLDESLDTSGELAVYFPLGEIVPSVDAITKRVLYDPKNCEIVKYVDKFDNNRHDARIIVESQALSARVRVAPLLSGTVDESNDEKSETMVHFDYDSMKFSEYSSKRPNRVYFVGGASKNDAIVKKFSEVLGAKNGNFRLETPNSCALGGCFKALWSDLWKKKKIDEKVTFDSFLNRYFPTDELEEIKVDDITKKWEAYKDKIIPLSKLEEELK